MANQTMPAAHYDMRRQARRPEAEAPTRSWKRQALWWTVATVTVASLGAGVWIYWRLNHVWTVRASVCGALVNLSPAVDAYLKELYVRPGQPVAKGEKLARLDDTELRAMLESSEAVRATRESDLGQAQATLRITEEEVDSNIELAQARLEATSATLTSSIAQLELRKARVAQEIRAAEAAYQEASARLDLVKKGPREEAIEACRQRLDAAKSLAGLYAYELEKISKLCENGVASEYDLKDKQTQLDRQNGAVRESELELAQLEAGATEEELEIANQSLESKGASLDLARTSAEEIKSMEEALKVHQAELREAEAQRKYAKARQAELALAAEKVKSAAAELKRAAADVEARQAALDGMLLVSPVDGTATRTFVQEGELCRKGAPLIQLIDNNEGRWFEGFIQERDARYVRVGQCASVEIVVGSNEEVDAVVDA
ncbi:MAG: efflux RND transporter periplasmic adaptor subunit, partial [Candidatus Sumerlaeota bacterium]|nr:efflux RND transporter periplasmic adaptor subunit [Candidatus Sumerlaeota bacterium]